MQQAGRVKMPRQTFEIDVANTPPHELMNFMMLIISKMGSEMVSRHADHVSKSQKEYSDAVNREIARIDEMSTQLQRHFYEDVSRHDDNLGTAVLSVLHFAIVKMGE